MADKYNYLVARVRPGSSGRKYWEVWCNLTGQVVAVSTGKPYRSGLYNWVHDTFRPPNQGEMLEWSALTPKDALDAIWEWWKTKIPAAPGDEPRVGDVVLPDNAPPSAATFVSDATE